MKMPIAPRPTKLKAWVTIGIHPVFPRAELDDRTLGRREVDRLAAPAAGVALGEADAFLDDGVEDRADDVERAVDVRPDVEDEDPNATLGRDLDRIVLVLVGDAVEDDEVGGRRRGVGLGVVGRLALGAEVPLALDERDLLVDLGQAALRLDDDHPEHAVRDVMERRGRAAVVHPDAGVVGGERVGERRAGLDLDHLVVHRGLAGVEVDRVAHRALVRQVDVDGVAEVHPDRRAWHLAAERPGLDDEAVATVMSLSTIGKSTSWTVPVRGAGAVASKRVYWGRSGRRRGAAQQSRRRRCAGVAAGPLPRP